MSFRVRELRRAQEDIVAIFEWLEARSPQGAKAWLDAYDTMLDTLRERAGSLGAAQESSELSVDIRQSLFKTRRGRVYRAVYKVDGEDVFILRVRGPGQAPVTGDDLGPQQ